ncbi:MAG: hypothetical protein CM15mP2_4230 [Methanobacteriota archaeon]|nr:MAG: hypothetical protein CM15mP2_4230 [Euryarchaeota archaeon]
MPKEQVWLLMVVHDVSAFHGYWPIEPRQVDPRLGTADQLKDMVDAAHTAGIRVMMDYVVNHVHEDHIYYQNNPEWFNQGCSAAPKIVIGQNIV